MNQRHQEKKAYYGLYEQSYEGKTEAQIKDLIEKNIEQFPSSMRNQLRQFKESIFLGQRVDQQTLKLRQVLKNNDEDEEQIKESEIADKIKKQKFEILVRKYLLRFKPLNEETKYRLKEEIREINYIIEQLYLQETENKISFKSIKKYKNFFHRLSFKTGGFSQNPFQDVQKMLTKEKLKKTKSHLHYLAFKKRISKRLRDQLYSEIQIENKKYIQILLIFFPTYEQLGNKFSLEDKIKNNEQLGENVGTNVSNELKKSRFIKGKEFFCKRKLIEC